MVIGDTAFLENDTNIMDIDKNARVSDDTGSTNGDHIKLSQNTGDFDATGHVTTTRLPEAKKSASALLDDSQPSQGLGRPRLVRQQESPGPLRRQCRALADRQSHPGRPDRYRSR